MTSKTLPITVLLTTSLLLGFSQTAWGGGDLGHLGSVAKWTKFEVDLFGPYSEGLSDSPNPFLIDVDVTFSGPGGSFVVPAFYAGDGNGNMDGEIWRARFSPNAVGLWSLSTSSSDSLLDGYSGSFDVTAPVGCAPYLPGGLPDFACVGRLEWVGDHYLKFADGPYWLKGGVDDPEDFLAPGQTAGFATKQDAIDYLASKAINSIYFMTQNVGGDGDNVSPWIGGDTEHFDIAKLDTWDAILDAIHEKGLVLHLVFEDDSGSTNFNRSLYYRQVVARFGHYSGLYWNLSEEYEENYSAAQVKGFAQLLSDLDPYNHPMTVHILSNLDHWLPFLGDDRFDLTSFHTRPVPQNDDAVGWFQLSEDSGRTIPIAFDETGISTADRVTHRHIVWSIYVGGAMYEIHTWPLNDYRDWEDYFEDILRARALMETLPFWQMRPNNQLLVSGAGYVLSEVGSVYLVYLPDGGAINLDLSSNTNLYDVFWYDPRTGDLTDDGSVTGGSTLPFLAPDSQDWVLLLEEASTGGNVAPVAIDQSLTTPLDTSLQFGLAFVDADGPGPYSFSVVQPPGFGSLSEIDPLGVLTYSPDSGFSGNDQFQWSVNDGIDESNQATVSILVDPPNIPPEAQDGSAATQVDTPVDITLQAFDSDGDTLIFQIGSSPSNGTLSSDDGDDQITYTPDPGFEGGDSFTFQADDGTDPSNVATVTVTVDSTPTIAFEDDFNRPDTEVVGNGWVELEQSGAVVRLSDQALYFHDSSDRLNRPLVRHDFPVVTAGVLTWDFDFDWQRTGSEGTYRVFMQLGDSAQLNDNDQNTGVAVNLLWSRLGGIHETLGYRTGSGDTGVVQISGPTQLTVLADLDAQSFELKVNDVSVATGLSFHNPVTVDTVRFFTDNVAEQNFAGRSFDSLVLTGGPPPPPNDPPTADDQSVAVDEDGSLPVTLSGSDPESDPLSYGIVSGPSQGSLAGTAPNVVYTPDADYFGPDSFTFQVDDGVNPPDLGTVSITVNAINDAPVAQAGSGSTQVDTAVDLTLVATDIEGDPLTFAPVTGPSNGTLSSDDGDALITYTPDPGYEGGDSFTFQAHDGTDPSNVATVSLTVFATNDPPTADDQVVVVPEDTPAPITLTGSDPDTDPLSFGIVTGPSQGALTGTAPNVTYTPNPNYFGPDSFTFQVDDGINPPDLGTVSITVTPVNDPPIAQDSNVVTQVDTPVDITLQAFDSDGDTLIFQIGSSPSNGTLSSDDGDDQITYTPDPGFEGGDSFTFQADDGTDPSNVATVTVTVDSTPTIAFEDDFNRPDTEVVGNGWVELEQSGAVVRLSDQALYFHDSSDRLNRPLVRHDFPVVTAGVLTWDFDFDWQRTGSEGTYRVFMQLGDSAQLNDNDQNTGVAANLLWSRLGGIHETLGYRTGSGDTGVVQISGPTQLTVLADLDAQSFELKVNDVSVATGLSFHNPVTVDTVRFFTDNVAEQNFAGRSFDSLVLTGGPPPPPNDPPTADDQSVAVDEDGSLPVTLSGSDPESDPLSYGIVSGPSQGSLAGTAPNVVYTPDADYFGPDSFTFQVDDGVNPPDLGTVSITVNAINDAPVAQAGSGSTQVDTAVDLTLVATDIEGDPLTFAPVTGPSNGTLSSDDGDALITYTPDPGYEGGDSFTFQAHDGTDPSNVATVSLTVFATNDPPTADDQVVVVPEDTPAPITLTGSDPDTDPLSFGIVTGPSQGALTGTAPNVTYTPNPNYFGPDSFTFQVDDGINPPDLGTVSITVTPVNDPPIAQDSNVVTQVDTPVDITLQAFDSDGDTLIFQIGSSPSNGTLSSDDGDDQITYTPDPGFEGGDSFTFQADDGTDPSNVATVTVTVDSTPTIAFEDDFNRPDTEVVGNGWVELEQSGAVVRLSDQALYFHDSSDRLNRPLVRHDFPVVTAGVLTWDFDFDWQRTGSEGTYRVFMQLGDSAQLNDNDQNTGVAVNLLWSRLGGIHETLGYRTGSGDTGVVQISGPTQLTVLADLDAQSFELKVNDVSVATGLAFQNPVSLDTIRFFTDGVNERNFRGRKFDEVVATAVP